MTTRRKRTQSGADLRVLFVCTANICRSPLAALYLEKLLDDAAAVASSSAPDVGVEVFSRGVLARPGAGMDPVMAGIASDLGLDPSEHVSAPLTRDDLERADLVVCMERRHTPYVTELLPRAVRSTITLRTLGALAAQEMPGDIIEFDDPRERAGWLLSTRGLVPVDPESADVPDPYRRSQRTYDSSVHLITTNVQSLAHALTRQ